jgi:hypothetical protein
MTATLFPAGTSEFMIRLSEISPEYASCWLNIAITFPTWGAELWGLCPHYFWLRSHSKSQPARINVQHVLPIELSIHPEHSFPHGPKKEFYRYGKKRDHQHLSV